MKFLHTVTLLWILCGVSAHLKDYENVALRGRATQSSIIYDVKYGYLSAAINAIDGNADPDHNHGSCSHTHNSYLSPWWRVDLLKSYKVAYITITNRGDCCSERLSGAEILVGDSLSDNGNNNPRNYPNDPDQKFTYPDDFGLITCTQVDTRELNGYERCGLITSIPAGGTQSFPCNGMVGRYVNIVLRGKQDYLHLCEVQVRATECSESP